MTTPRRYACTWLFADSVNEESTYYQVPGRSSSASFQAVYWRCVALFFATSARQQRDVDHVLFTNVDALPVVDGVSMASLLDSLSVEVVRLPLTFRTPPGYYHAWANQFYVFDIVRSLAERLEPGDTAVLLDSDCVWASETSELWETLAHDHSLTYVIDYPVDWVTNGLTRVELSVVAGELLGRRVEAPLAYCGGELVAGSGSSLRELWGEIESLWPALLDRRASEKPTFNEEGQALSFLYYKLGYPVGNGDRFVRRIWTGSVGAFNDVRASDRSLVVWHVPLEKRFGIRRLFPQVADASSQLWSCTPQPELRDLLGAALGVPRNGPLKTARDLATRIADALRER